MTLRAPTNSVGSARAPLAPSPARERSPAGQSCRSFPLPNQAPGPRGPRVPEATIYDMRIS
jgi:hypothetical protein